VQNCDQISTPFAEHERKEFIDYAGGSPLHAPLAYHWTRMIEMLHAAEVIKELLHDDDLLSDDLMVAGRAPDGRCWRHRSAARHACSTITSVDENDIVITMANLIVSTTNNNQAMNEAIRHVAKPLPAWPRGDGRAAQPHRSRHPRLRPLPVLRHPCAGQDAAGGGAG
jgi:NAD-reducing hydrogenase large subunit